MVHRRIMTPTRIIDYLTKSPVSDVEKPPVELLVKEVQEASKTIEAIAIPLDWFPGFERKPLLLKILHILYIGFRAIKQELTWKFPSKTTSSHSIRRCYTSFQGIKAVNPTQIFRLKTTTTISQAAVFQSQSGFRSWDGEGTSAQGNEKSHHQMSFTQVACPE